jgi:hypothetical protein
MTAAHEFKASWRRNRLPHNAFAAIAMDRKRSPPQA